MDSRLYSILWNLPSMMTFKTQVDKLQVQLQLSKVKDR